MNSNPTTSSSKMAQSIAPWSETDRRIAAALGTEIFSSTTTMSPTPNAQPAQQQAISQPLAPKSHNARQPKVTSPEGTGKGQSKTTQSKRPADDSAQDEDGQTPAGKKRKVSNNTASNTKSAKHTKKSADDLLDVSDITLPNEEVGRVPVYETCNSIRTQIRAILKKPGMTQAAFCRALGKYGAVPDGKSPSSRQLTTFLDKKGGPMKGNTNPVFYPSYVLFEKMRIRDGKDKTKFRKEMEEKHAKKGGVNIDVSTDRPLWMHVSERAYTDRWGCLHIEKKASYL